MEIRPFRFDRAFACEKPVVEQEVLGDLLNETRRLRDELARTVADAEERVRTTGEAAFHAGLNQGREEGRGALLAAVDALHAGIDDLDDRFASAMSSLKGEAAAAVLAAADAIAGHDLERQPGRAIDMALGAALKQVARGTGITLNVHPTLVEDLADCLARRQARDRRRLAVTILPDEALVPGDARLTWVDGGATLDRAARRRAVVEELRPLLPPSLEAASE